MEVAMTTRLLGLLIITLTLMGSIGCSGDRHLMEDRTIVDVKGVFYHEEGRYTLFVGKSDNRLVPFTFGDGNGRANVQIFADVPDGYEMWAHVRTTRGNGYDAHDLEIHIHSIRDIAGAGWNHGKFGRGTTVRITP